MCSLYIYCVFDKYDAKTQYLLHSVYRVKYFYEYRDKSKLDMQAATNHLVDGGRRKSSDTISE